MPETHRFANFIELKQRDSELRIQRPDSSEKNLPQASAAAIREFLGRARATGKILAEDVERKEAQAILDFWSFELAASKDAIPSDYAPASLDQNQDKAAVIAANDTNKSMTAERPSEAIRIAALARQWRATGQSGYLLTDKKSIEQAKNYQQFDPDIALLVAASQVARYRSMIFRLSTLSVLLVLVTGLITGNHFFWQLRESERKLAEIEVNYKATEKRLLEERQKQIETIKNLEALLNKNKIPSDRNIAESEIPDLVTAIAKNDYSEKKTDYQEGYIWAGGDVLGKSNIGDRTTGTPILVLKTEVDKDYRVIGNNLVFRKALPSDNYTMSESLGVITEGTTITVLGRPVPFKRDQGLQYWLKVKVQQSAPIVYFQYTTGSNADARAVAVGVGLQGFRIAGAEETKLAKDLNAVRYYFDSDEAAAKKLADEVGKTLKALNYKLDPPRVESYVKRQGSRNYPGVIELWIDLPERPHPWMNAPKK